MVNPPIVIQTSNLYNYRIESLNIPLDLAALCESEGDIVESRALESTL